jgi:chromosome segregation ATPase
MNDTGSFSSETGVDVRSLEERVAELRAQLEAERAAGPFTLGGLKAELAQAQAEVERASAAAEKAKAQARKRKDEIDAWKAWYNGLAEDEQEVGMAKLQSEIKWRAAELETLTPQISDLLATQAQAVGELQLAQQKLIAFEAGVFDRPIEEDPRLVFISKTR